jgi:hypothetical protein
VMNIVDSETVFTKSQPLGSGFVHTPIQDSFCGEAVKQDAVLEVNDAPTDPRFSSRGIVTEHGMRFYAGFPIHAASGETVATLCLLDTEPRRLSDTDLSAFERFGEWAQAEIRQGDPVATEPEAVDGPSAITRDREDDSGVQLAALAIPHGSASGDRSAWLQSDGRIVVTLTDIMGKGERASGFAETLIEVLHRYADLSPVDAVRTVEDEARGDERYHDTFATLFHAVIDTSTGHVDYLDAGHGLTLVLRADGGAERLASRNLPLGLRPRDVEWEPGETTVVRGDLIVSVSDGALDAYDSTLDSLRQIGDDLRRAHGADAFFDELTVRVTEHVVDDDVTAVVVSIH